MLDCIPWIKVPPKGLSSVGHEFELAAVIVSQLAMTTVFCGEELVIYRAHDRVSSRMLKPYTRNRLCNDYPIYRTTHYCEAMGSAFINLDQ